MLIDFDAINKSQLSQKQLIEPKKLEADPLKIEEAINGIKRIEANKMGAMDNIIEMTSVKKKKVDDRSGASSTWGSSNTSSAWGSSNKSDSWAGSNRSDPWGGSDKKFSSDSINEVVERVMSKLREPCKKTNILDDSVKLEFLNHSPREDKLKYIRKEWIDSVIKTAQNNITNQIVVEKIENCIRSGGDFSDKFIEEYIHEQIRGVIRHIRD